MKKAFSPPKLERTLEQRWKCSKCGAWWSEFYGNPNDKTLEHRCPYCRELLVFMGYYGKAEGDPGCLSDSNWISVKERLPKTWDDVLTISEAKDQRVRYMDEDGEWLYPNGNSERHHIPTHWQPLPEPPKEEK